MSAHLWFSLVNQVAWAYVISTVMQLFRDLIKPNQAFYWDDTLDHLFESSKKIIIDLVKEGVKSFNISLKTYVQPDWSCSKFRLFTWTLVTFVSSLLLLSLVLLFMYTCPTVLEFNCCCMLNAEQVNSLNMALRYNIGDEILIYPEVCLDMASINLQPVPPFVVNAEIGLSLASQWKLWLHHFKTFLLASGITDKKHQCVLLLYQAGPQVCETFAQLSDVGGESAFALAKGKLTQYFEPQKNRRYKVYHFREQKQGEQESLDNFHTRLHNMAKGFEFHDENVEIEEQIISGGHSS